MAYSKEQWEDARIDYEIHGKSLNQISKDYRISYGAVNKKSKKEGWKQSKSDKVITDSIEAMISLEEQKVIRSDNFSIKENKIIEKVIDSKFEIEKRILGLTNKVFDKVEDMIPLCETPDHLLTIQKTIKEGRESTLGKEPIAQITNTNAQQDNVSIQIEGYDVTCE